MTARNLAHGRYAITADRQIGRLTNASTSEVVRYVLSPLPGAPRQGQFSPLPISRGGVIMYTVDPNEVISLLMGLAAYAGNNRLTLRPYLPEQVENPDTGPLWVYEYCDSLYDDFAHVAAGMNVRGLKATIIFYVLFRRVVDPSMFS